MEAIYKDFARIYDIFMRDTPYDEWVAYVEKLWERYSCAPKLVLDLACGSGSITHRLWARGYDMIGLDNSPDMLSLASQKAHDHSADILYILQDMRSFELYGTVDSVICLCDGLNYIQRMEDLEKVFKQVNNYLNPGGLFIFDMNTEYKFKHILGSNTFSELDTDAAYIWENQYDDVKKLNTYHMSFFVETSRRLYERFEETHYQRAFEPDTVCNLLISAGLRVEGVFHEGTFGAPVETSERIYFVVHK